MLVLRLADWWHHCTAPCPPERQCNHRRVEITDIYIFRNKGFFSSRGFLDIEKSVLLELKGVKVIRRKINTAVMTLPFGGTRCGTRMSPIGQSQHQHLRLIGTTLGTDSVLVDILSVQQQPCWLRQMLSSYQSKVLVMRPTDSRRAYSASCIPER